MMGVGCQMESRVAEAHLTDISSLADGGQVSELLEGLVTGVT